MPYYAKHLKRDQLPVDSWAANCLSQHRTARASVITPPLITCTHTHTKQHHLSASKTPERIIMRFYWRILNQFERKTTEMFMFVHKLTFSLPERVVKMPFPMAAHVLVAAVTDFFI